MTQFSDAFISYGRADSKAFAEKLQASLDQRGFRVWFDFNDIPLAVDFQNQIDDGIEKADNFLFIISPHSVNSPYCRKEIELAVKLNKRIIPLLHVMEISRETWQQRNPQGTDEEWETYKAKGLHQSYPNMHPIISKLNWVMFEEGINDFDKSLEDLIYLVSSHTDYVKQHTQLLVKALEWERDRKQTSYLLVGEEKQQAETWLKIRFQDEQPPCIPSDLHCEYITESIKNGNSLMAQVFLSHSDEERGTMEKIRNSLRREGVTVWTNSTDIQTGEAFEEAIKRGIEQADNLVYLLSPDSVNSMYCQQELNLAISLNKRIIPILVRETDPERVPPGIQHLHYIDLTDNVKEEDYQLDDRELVRIVRTDAAYYNEHKILLAKALKWQRQEHNPSILLRGYNLRSAEAWLKVARTRNQHPPTPLQEEFIAESLRQPPLESVDVFISYSRADSDFARKLNDALQQQGKTTWFDQESIASGTDFQQEIYGGIKASDNFLFVLSPRAVSSPYCASEVEQAASLNKRFVTVLHRPVNTSDLHPELAKVQWIDFNRNRGDFNANFNQLVRTLDTDREHLSSHTKWLHLALEWEQKGKSDDLLLRGNEFAMAQNWLQTALGENKRPAPTTLQQMFIESSHKAIVAAEEAEKNRQAELLRLQEEKRKEAEARLAEEKKSARRQKFFLAVTGAGFLVSTALGLVALVSYRKAIESENHAKIAHAEALAKSSEAFHARDRKFDALLEALQAKKKLQNIQGVGNHPDIEQAVDAALQQAVFGLREYNRLSGHNAGAIAVAFSPDERTIASGGEDDKLLLWNEEGELLKTLSDHQGSVNSVAFSPDGKLMASASTDKTVKLWNRDGVAIATLKRHANKVTAVAFSPDGELLASASDDKTVILWNRDGRSVDTLEGHANKVKAVAFSPDGELIVSAGDDNNAILWNRDGSSIATLEGHADDVNSVAFSPDGETIATASDDSTVILWNRDGTKLQTLTGHADRVNSVAFSPDGETIASASDDKTVKLWWREGTLLDTLSGHSDRVKSVSFSRDGQTIASASKDNTVRLWKLIKFDESRFLNILYEHQDGATAVAFSSDGEYIATASNDKTVKLWQRREGKLLRTIRETAEVADVAFSPNGELLVTGIKNNKVNLWKLDGTLLPSITESDKLNSVSFSPDGQLLATASDDNTIKLWRLDRSLLATMTEHEDNVNSLDFSKDGQLIVSGSSDNTIKLWNRSGKLLSTLTAHHGPVNDVSFSPDGQTIASGGEDNKIKLWRRDETLLTLVDTLEEHGESVNEVVFSSDGQILASVSADTTIKLWKRDGNGKWQEKTTLYEHSDIINDIAFGSGNESLISVGDDNKIVWWNVKKVLQPQQLQSEGCKWLSDYLQANQALDESGRALCDGY